MCSNCLVAAMRVRGWLGPGQLSAGAGATNRGGRRIVRRDHGERAAFIEVQRTKICAANVRRISQYGLKHWIEIARRTRNDT